MKKSFLVIAALLNINGYADTTKPLKLGTEDTHPSAEIYLINYENFEKEVLQSSIPVIISFWAEWCGSCKIVAPLLTKVAKEANGNFKIVKINIDENPKIAEIYGVRSIPTLLIFNRGKVVAEKTRAFSVPQIQKWIADSLKKHYSKQ